MHAVQIITFVNFLYFAERKTASIISRSLRIRKFTFFMLKTIGIEIMHNNVKIDWIGILEI